MAINFDAIKEYKRNQMSTESTSSEVVEENVTTTEEVTTEAPTETENVENKPTQEKKKTKAQLEREASEKRIEQYKSNVITVEDLTKETPKVTINKNRQGLKRYIFINELIACKNGFMYYSIPLLIGIVFLIINSLTHNFWYNCLASIILLCVFLCIKSAFNKIRDIKRFIILSFFSVALIVGFILLLIYLPNFKESLYIPFVIKIFIIVFDIYFSSRFFVCFFLCYAGDCQQDSNTVATIKAGPPGAGKTSNAVHEGRVQALKNWSKLQYEYFIYSSKEKEILKRCDFFELLDYYEVKVAYQFYSSKKCIPCLVSNIGMKDFKGNKCHKLTLNQLKGLERLPMYTVVVCDEIGAFLKADMSTNKNRPYDVSDLFRLGRHFLKWTFIGTEQDFNNYFIDARRVVGKNELYTAQEWVCKPGLLFKVYNFIHFLIADFLDKKIKKKPILSKFMDKFEKFVNSIGFRRYTYNIVSNTQTASKQTSFNDKGQLISNSGTRRRYVPSTLICKYNQRGYKQTYPSYFDKEIKLDLHKSIELDGSDKDYAMQFVSTTSLLEEKRNSICESIKYLSDRIKQSV